MVICFEGQQQRLVFCSTRWVRSRDVKITPTGHFLNLPFPSRSLHHHSPHQHHVPTHTGRDGGRTTAAGRRGRQRRQDTTKRENAGPSVENPEKDDEGEQIGTAYRAGKATEGMGGKGWIGWGMGYQGTRLLIRVLLSLSPPVST